jgi:tripartite-type tricarboxylate transporter receptor subunit TctC
MIPRLMPGGGSLVMANYLYNQAAKDGTAIGMFSGSLPGQVMLGLNNVKLDLQKFQYIGSPQSSDNACVVLTKSGINSVEDAMKREVSLAGTGPTSTDGFLPPILNEMIGTKFHVIQGYQSSGEGFLAVDRGEVDGACFTLSTTQAMEGASLSNGSLKILFTTNEQRSLPDVPSIFEYVKSEEDRQILSFLQSSAMIGRPMAVPPSVPADRVEALRQAFEQMSKDPEFLAEVKSMNRLDFTFTSGAQLEKLVSNLLSTPQPVVARAKSFMPASQ